MLSIHVTLLHGTLRAASPDDLALTGEPDPGDWPPSPARIVAALVAGDGTRDRCRATNGNELSLFENAPPPLIYADPRAQVLQSPQVNRYVVVDKTENGSVQEYAARTATAVRPGTRLAPRDPRVSYVWENVTASTSELAALAARAARVGYLGCADSPAHITVQPSFDPAVAPTTRWEPVAAGRHLLSVPFPGFVEVLDRAFDEWTAGKQVRRSWYRVERERYQDPDDPAASSFETEWPTIFWVRFEPPLPGRVALRTTEGLKAAVLDLYQRHVARSPLGVPPVLHGHGFDMAHGYQLAQWLVLPEAGHAHAKGKLHGAAIMLPRAAERSVVAGVRTAISSLHELVIPGRGTIGVRMHAGEPRPWTANPHRWQGPARRWVSVLPVVHERWRRRGPGLDDVAEWCSHAGMPVPVQARLAEVPLIAGALSLQPHEVFRQRDDARRPYSHLEIVFAERVRGPVVLGRARQFGMGLMAPVDAQA